MGVNLENQTADQLQITSSYNGNTNLSLRNTASTANETNAQGIKLVDISDTAEVNGTFELLGGEWNEGGYVYKLFQDSGDPDYYLRSTQQYSDPFKTMANIPMLNAVIARAGMNSLNKRMGDLRDMNNPARNQGVWARTYYKDMTVSDLLKTDMSLFGVEAGYDWLFTPDEPNKIYAGVMIGYINANEIKTRTSIGNNKGSGEAPSVGVYATIINDNNWFVDFAVRNFWTKIKNTTLTSSNTLLFNSKRNLFTASVEVGKDIEQNNLKMEPKVELSYMRAGSDTTNVEHGVGDLSYSAENYLTGKAAIMLSYKAQMTNTLLIEPLLELAYNYEFNGKGKVSYGGAETETSLKGGHLEVDAGVNVQLTEDVYLYTLGSYEKGSKIDGFGLQAGIRAAFGNNTKKKKEKIKKQTAPQQQEEDYLIRYYRQQQYQQNLQKEQSQAIGYQQAPVSDVKESVAKPTTTTMTTTTTTSTTTTSTKNATYNNDTQNNENEITKQQSQTRRYKFTKPRKFKKK